MRDRPNPLQQKRIEANAALPVVRSNLLLDADFADATVFPSAIQPFESFPGKSRTRMAPKNEVGIRDRTVLFFVPSFAHAEVVKQIADDVRFEWNLHEGRKYFRGLPEVRFGTGYIDQPELRKLSEKREIALQMADKIRECRCTFMDVGKRHHRRGRNEEHRELIHEMPDGSAGGLATQVESGRKIVLLDVQSPAKEADLFWLGFKVLIPVIQENEIEHSDAPLDVFELVFPTIADVLAFDLPIEAAGEEVVDRPALRKAFGSGVFSSVKFGPEGGRALAPMCTGEREKLASREVAGMRRHNVEKAGFCFRVAEAFKSFEMRRCDVHSVRILAVISRSSRTRRKRDTSSERP